MFSDPTTGRTREARIMGAPLATGIVLLAVLAAGPAAARDFGQWQNIDPITRAWFGTLMQPDNPTRSCCAEGDAYWADVVHVETDERGGPQSAKVTERAQRSDLIDATHLPGIEFRECTAFARLHYYGTPVVRPTITGKRVFPMPLDDEPVVSAIASARQRSSAWFPLIVVPLSSAFKHRISRPLTRYAMPMERDEWQHRLHVSGIVLTWKSILHSAH
jgi:hypothetical protein